MFQDTTFNARHSAVYNVQGNLYVGQANTEAGISNSPLQSQTPPAPPPIFFGRDVFVAKAVCLINNSHPARLAILGAGGIGKTSVALAILHHEELQLKFAKRHYFVSCEAATTTSLLLQTILSVMGVQLGSKQNPLTILHQTLVVQPAPLLLVLDNFETPWDESDSQTEVEFILRKIAAVPHVTLIVAM